MVLGKRGALVQENSPADRSWTTKGWGWGCPEQEKGTVELTIRTYGKNTKSPLIGQLEHEKSKIARDL